MNFVDFGLAEPIGRAVVASGYTTPTPIQAAAIPEAMAGADVLGLAQTGTGKTAAFLLPTLHRLLDGPKLQPNDRRRIRSLILSPTRELAQQIADSLLEYGCHTGLKHTVLVGGVSMSPQIKALARGVDIVIATPGRLEDLMRQGRVDLRNVTIFVLDEADRMLDIGFLPSVQRIGDVLPKERQTLFFSATMSPAVSKLADNLLYRPVKVNIAPVAETTKLITESVYMVPRAHKSRLLITLLTNQPIERALVFTRTKHGADRVAQHLRKAGIPSEAIHGNKTQAARQRALVQFRSSSPPVLVATDVAARGLDIDNVSHVFNYDLPNEPETYTHRIGRTGRAGASGAAISFCDETERYTLRDIERLIRRQIPNAPQIAQADLAKMPEGGNDHHESDSRDSGPRGRFADRGPGRSQRQSTGPRRPMNNDRPRDDRPRDDRPREDRPREDRGRPAFERPAQDRPAGRPFQDRPPQDRPYGDRPPQNRAYGDRPAQDRPYGDRPSQDRRPASGGPSHNRPAHASRPGEDRRPVQGHSPNGEQRPGGQQGRDRDAGNGQMTGKRRSKGGRFSNAGSNARSRGPNSR